MKSQGRLLAMHPGALGDLVLTFPVLRGLRNEWGALDLLCAGNLGALAAHLGVADQFFPLESARFAGIYQPRISDARLSAFFREYDAVLLFSRSEMPERAILSAAGPRVHRILPRPPAGRRVHVTEFIRKQMEEIGPFPQAVVPPVNRPGRIYGPILLHPGSGSPRKNWPPEKFVEARARLRDRGFSTRFLLGPAESSFKEALNDWREEIVVPEDLAALSDRLQSAGGWIGNDSGASHLAAFLGVPTAAVFGPSDPVRWRPAGPRVAVVAPRDEKCAPCFEETNRPDCPDRRCLEAISVESVISAFLSLFLRSN